MVMFQMVALDFMPIEIGLYRIGEKKPIAKTSKDILVENPLGIDKTYPYFSETLA